MARDVKVEPYRRPSGGWGSVRSLGDILKREGVPVSGARTLRRQNKPGGYACVSCAWAKPDEPHLFEFCENGAKATAWEITAKRAPPAFFAQHTLSELERWPDHDLEKLGRLTEPMRWDAATDRYRPVAWADAFGEIAAELRRLDPKREVVFYTSGRASNEASYMWALMARLFGTNNLPDSSNMCHESTSVGLPESIGTPVGTVELPDFETTDCIFLFGQNIASNAPRLLHQLQEAAKRDVPLVNFNPLREPGLERFTNPQAPAEMLSGSSTRIASELHQLAAGGDIAAIMGICKAVMAMDDAAAAANAPRVLDAGFIAEHTHGFEAFAAVARGHDWAELERHSGLTRNAMEGAAALYARSNAVLGLYGMGLTQQKHGVANVQMLMNLLLLRGNIGRPGAGVCAIRGHSNVQGQRTVGITEKPELVPLDKLAEQYGFAPPREPGMATVATCEAILSGQLRAFVSLGGNFIRAVPETAAMERAWRKLRLTVQISTKLNRSHLLHGEVAYILPCLGRIEVDQQASGPQAVTIEDSTGHIHRSLGNRRPAGPKLLSEPKIVAELAKALLPPNPKVPWDAWVGDYSRVREAIAVTYPKVFHGYNDRMATPGGFARPLGARERQWETATGKANFLLPPSLSAAIEIGADRPDVIQLITLRSNDQFNTTIYGYDDRFRGIDGTRMVVFMNRIDMGRLGLAEGDMATLATAVGDDVRREVAGLRVTAFDMAPGCCAAYFPECNPLIPLWHHAERSHVPAAKAIPVTVRLPAVAEASA